MGSVPLTDPDLDPGGPKHTDPAESDSDPQHFLQEYINTRKYCTVSASTVRKNDHSRIQIIFMLFDVLYMHIFQEMKRPSTEMMKVTIKKTAKL